MSFIYYAPDSFLQYFDDASPGHPFIIEAKCKLDVTTGADLSNKGLLGYRDYHDDSAKGNMRETTITSLCYYLWLGSSAEAPAAAN